MEAWLIRWYPWAPHGAQDEPVVSFLNPELPSQEISKIVELLYGQFAYTLEELAHFAKNPDNVPYRSQISELPDGYAKIICGHNPTLYACKVRNLDFSVSAKTEHKTIKWEEQLGSGEWQKLQAVQAKPSNKLQRK